MQNEAKSKIIAGLLERDIINGIMRKKAYRKSIDKILNRL